MNSLINCHVVSWKRQFKLVWSQILSFGKLLQYGKIHDITLDITTNCKFDT